MGLIIKGPSIPRTRPSQRLTFKTCQLVNHLIFDHILIQPPHLASNRASIHSLPTCPTSWEDKAWISFAWSWRAAKPISPDAFNPWLSTVGKRPIHTHQKLLRPSWMWQSLPMLAWVTVTDLTSQPEGCEIAAIVGAVIARAACQAAQAAVSDPGRPPGKSAFWT